MWRRVSSLTGLLSHSKPSLLNQAPHRFNLLEDYLTRAKDGASPTVRTLFVTFVLGGPGSGKGTQCEKIVETFGFTHLSAGDLLRQAISSNYEDSAMIFNTIKEGKIVPSEVTVKLIQRAIESSNNYKFLIDGFPRSEENRVAFEKIIGAEPDVVLFFDVPEEEVVKRVLSRNQGRIDDNIDTVKKRLEVFSALNLPVIKHYSELGKVQKINAVGTTYEIFDRVHTVFAAYEAVICLDGNGCKLRNGAATSRGDSILDT